MTCGLFDLELIFLKILRNQLTWRFLIQTNRNSTNISGDSNITQIQVHHLCGWVDKISTRTQFMKTNNAILSSRSFSILSPMIPCPGSNSHNWNHYSVKFGSALQARTDLISNTCRKSVGNSIIYVETYVGQTIYYI